ncbi:complement factor H-related protein 1-like isoform 1-T3 [Macrochelys suwanniensis]
MENRMVELNGTANENILQWVYLKRGDFLELRCKPGYALATNSSQSTFMVQCHGNPIVYPECKEIICDPPGVVNGRFRPQRNMYRDGDVLIITCNHGFYINDDQDTAECTMNGWLPPPGCSNILCQGVPDVFNAQTEGRVKDSYKPGETVRYQCHSGFIISGSPDVICRAGKWTQKPVCEEVTCKPPKINNGNLMTPDRVYRENERLQFTCNPGYTFGERSDANCTVYGWNPKPFCKEIRCDPPTVMNGSYQPKKKVFRELEVIRVDCNQGFHFETDNRDRRAQCTKNGWLPIPRCILRPCDYPHIENGALTDYYENNKERAFPAQLGVSIYYRCLDGYVSEREERWPLIRCTKVGWSPAPKCFKKCSPGHLENGKFLSGYWNTYKEGDEISYVCFPENLQAKVTCTKNGWSPTPSCTSNKAAGKCGLPPATDNGDIIAFVQPVYESGSTVEYRCLNLHVMRGSQFIRCESGQWTNPPVCLEPCTVSPEEMEKNNIVLKWKENSKLYSESGDFIEFGCKRGYEVDRTSSVFRVQCVEGKLAYPKCKKSGTSG